MPRTARITLLDTPHHITQRGSRRGPVFFNDQDRALYLTLLKNYADKYGTLILGYCLMENHVHHILVPTRSDSLARTLSSTHRRYAQVVNGRNNWTGHLWQQRFFSSCLDKEYFFSALKYVERNPVKAKMVEKPWDYEWSSARGHCSLVEDPILTKTGDWCDLIYQKGKWSEFLHAEDDTEAIKLIRQQTQRDRPSGGEAFLLKMEELFNVRLLSLKRGRPQLNKLGTHGTVTI